MSKASLGCAAVGRWGSIASIGTRCTTKLSQTEGKNLSSGIPRAARFSLDSNLLVYAADERDAVRQNAAIEIVTRAARSDCVLTLQSLAEFFHVATRKGIIPRSEAAAQVHRWMAVFTVAPGATVTALSSAMEAAASGRFQFYDALLLAAAREAGCTAVISEDMADGAKLDGVRIVAPFDEEGGISADVLKLL